MEVRPQRLGTAGGALLRRAELAVHARAYAAVRADALAAHRLRPLAPEPLYWLALGSWPGWSVRHG